MALAARNTVDSQKSWVGKNMTWVHKTISWQKAASLLEITNYSSQKITREFPNLTLQNKQVV
jgi:hypothetical protein